MLAVLYLLSYLPLEIFAWFIFDNFVFEKTFALLVHTIWCYCSVPHRYHDKKLESYKQKCYLHSHFARNGYSYVLTQTGPYNMAPLQEASFLQ